MKDEKDSPVGQLLKSKGSESQGLTDNMQVFGFASQWPAIVGWAGGCRQGEQHKRFLNPLGSFNKGRITL